MGSIANIIHALRRIGSVTQKSALKRQDRCLDGAVVKNRRREISRSASGTAETFVATVEARPESIRPMSSEELDAVGENAALFNKFHEVFLGSIPQPWGLEHLDTAFASWARSRERMGYDDEATVQILGAAFGQYCSRTLDMSWVVITDAAGAAAALRGAKTDFRSFPFHSIRKRIQDREEGFFKPIFITLEQAATSDRFAPIK